MTTGNSLVTTGETGDSRNVRRHPGAGWVGAPACVFREEEAQQTHGEAFRRTIMSGIRCSGMKCLVLGVWCYAQVLAQ